MNDVPYLDLVRQHAAVRTEILEVVAEAIDKAGFVSGKRLADFEREFASYCGTAHCIGVANGTDAIKLALAAAGAGRGDEVVVPAFTFVATAGAVVDCGATPILADVDPGSASIDPAAVARRIGPRTKAVVAVHLYGLPCDVPALRAAIDAAAPGRRITLVEDCAQAHGASRGGLRTGAMGDIAAFSFYPTKNLGAMGDGGAITTDDEALAAAVREISDHGRPADGTRRNEHLRVGVNSRLDAIQAAVLSVKLRRLPEWNGQRAAAARRYREALGSRADVRLQDLPAGVVHAWYVYALRHERRDALAAALARRGVQARAVYPSAIHEYPAYAFLGHRPGDFPAAEAWAREVLTLPMFALMRDDEIDRACAATIEALDEVGARG